MTTSVVPINATDYNQAQGKNHKSPRTLQPMQKYSFLDDYSEGCHPQILEALASTNLIQQSAYGHDEYSEKAKISIRTYLDADNDLPIFFVAGGTQANLIIIASILRPHEAVISASSGHIELHETGAIEAVGHKILTAPSSNGKLTANVIESVLLKNSMYPHVAKPRLVYISNSTELGTIYSKSELVAIAETCRENDLLLMLDGARLGAALTSEKNNLSLHDISDLVDVFWIGGTKTGALFGEAIVISNPSLAVDFEFHIKQRGALLAKGRTLGIQFLTLFENGLFFELGGITNTMAKKLELAISDEGYSFAAPCETNQLFPILPNVLIEKLEQKFLFHRWGAVDGEFSTIRLVTSWATQEDRIDSLIRIIREES